jgi:HEAT repeat protein
MVASPTPTTLKGAETATAQSSAGPAAEPGTVRLSVEAQVTPTPPAVEPRLIAEPKAALLAANHPDAESHGWTARTEAKTLGLTMLCRDANASVLQEVAKLDHQDPAVRDEGLRSLAFMGPDASSAALAVRTLLRDDVELVRAHAAWAVWELTGDAATVVQPLTELLSSDDSDVVQFAAYTLSGIGAPAAPALPALDQILRSEDRRIRLHAAEATVKIASGSQRDEALETLIVLTAEPNKELRTLAVVTLGSVSDVPTPAITTALTSALHDSDAEVRAAAALTLGAFGPSAKASVAQLEFVAENDHQDVQQAAATALECIRR